LDWPDVSPVSAAAVPQIIQGLVCQGIEPAGGNIFFDLPVTSLGVQLGKPSPKSREVLERKLADSILDLLKSAHAGKLNSAGYSTQSRSEMDGFRE
jgi:hypothetical protein